MSKKKIIIGSSFNSLNIPLTWDEIFNGVSYDRWNFNNSSSLTLSGSLIDQIRSSKNVGRNFNSSGTNRPTLVFDSTLSRNVARFDGVSDYMNLASLTAFNFLHDGTGGIVIVVMKQDSGTGNTGIILRNFYLTSEAGFQEVTVESTGNYNSVVARGVTSTFAVSNATGSGLTSGSWNSKVGVYDADNGTAADRSEVYLNNGSAVKNNVLTNSVSTASSGQFLTMGILPPFFVSFPYDGDIAEIIIAETLPSGTMLADIQARLEEDYGTFPI